MLIAGRVVTPAGVVAGWVETAGERIVAVGEGSAPAGAAGTASWSIVAGFVDVHVHGGGGHSFTAGDPDAVVGGVRVPSRPRDDDDAAQPRDGACRRPRRCGRADPRVARRG